MDNLNDEFESYLDHETRLNLDRGMSPEAARAAALRKFGNRGLIQETIYYQSRSAFLDSLLHDIRYALRNLRRAPQFTLLAVLSLALGIGVNSSVFSVICAEVYPRLPYRDYPGILRLYSTRVRQPGLFNLSARDLAAVRQTARSYSAVAAQQNTTFNVTAPGAPPERVAALRVTSGFFGFLGVAPALGRDFRDDEARGEGSRVAILGYSYWDRRFSRNPAVLGATLGLDGDSYTIIGVLPQHFHWLSWRNTDCSSSPSERSNCLDVYVPSSLESAANPKTRDLLVVARLAPGATLGRADAEMRGLAAALAQAFPDSHRDFTAGVKTLDASLHALAPGFIVMQCAVALVLLIACANAANLLLGRALARSQEIAVRSAIGATRGRLVRQLLTEGAILSLLAALAGLAFTTIGARLMANSIESNLIDGPIDARILAFTLAASVITTLVFALVPALQVSRMGAAETLRLSGRTFTSGRRSGRLRNALIVAEIGLCLVLLISAGLLTRSLSNLLNVPLGFNTRNIVFARLPLTAARYADASARSTALRQVLARAGAMPGVSAAAMVSGPPLYISGAASAGLPDDARPLDELPHVRYRAVSQDYLRVLEVLPLQGRDFAPADTSHSVILVNQACAAAFWPAQNPIGKRLRIDGAAPAEVVGVFPDLRTTDMRRPAESEVLALSDSPDRSPWIIARVTANPASFLASLQSVLAGVDPDLPVAEMKTMTAALDGHLIEVRASMQWLTAFAAIALLMAAMGIYGVISYTVAQRRQEIAIRIALGAAPRSIARLIAGHTARLAASGIAAGLLVSVLATRALGGALYGVSSLDLPTFTGAAALLFAIALAAVIVPIRTAAAVDPRAAGL